MKRGPLNKSSNIEIYTGLTDEDDNTKVADEAPNLPPTPAAVSVTELLSPFYGSRAEVDLTWHIPPSASIRL